MWRRRRSSRPRNADRSAADLANECELFLRGRYVEHVRAASRPVPAWARLNLLAHGTAAELAALRSERCDGTFESEWAVASAHLANEILANVDGDADRLRELQLRVLIPFELRLALNWPLTMRPTLLVELVSHELERCR